jgi:WD40 repeat protein
MRPKRLHRPVAVAVGLVSLSLSASAQAPRLPEPTPDTTRDVTRGITTSISRNIEAAVVQPRLVVRKPAGPVVRLDLAPDERSVALVLERGEVRFWDLETGVQRPRIAIAGATARVAVPLLDGRSVLVGCADGSLRLVEAATARELAKLGAHRRAVTDLVLSADGRRAASASSDGSLRLWDVAAQREIRAVEVGGDVAALSIRADGELVAVAGEDGTLRVWDGGDTKIREVASGPQDAVALAFVREGRTLAVAGRNGEIALVDVDGGAPAGGASAGGAIMAAAFSPDGSEAAVGDEDASLRLVPIAGGAPRSLPGHQAALRGVAFAPRNARLFSADAGGVLRVFSLESGENLLRAISTETGWAVIDRQGRFDGSEQGMRDVGWSAGEREIDLEKFAQRFFEPGLLAAFARKGSAPLSDVPGRIEDGIELPPKVSIDLPDASREAGKPFQLVVVAEDQGGGIGEIRLYHNGKLVVPGALLQQQDVDTGRQRLRAAAFRVNPVPGVNTLRGVASGQWGIEGESERTTLEFEGRAAPATLRLLAVGIDHYADPKLDLDYAVRDSQELVKRLREGAATAYGAVEVQELRDADATRERILAALRGLAASAPEDVLVIYLAGHGMVSKDDWVFLPHETRSARDPEAMARSGIRAAEIRDVLVDARSQRVLVLIDSCESGGGVESFERFDRFQRRYIREVSRLAGVSVVAATRKDQLAAEIQQLGHGLFTWVLLSGLGGDADRTPRDGLVTAHELVAFSAATTPDVSRKYLRHPQEPLAFALGADFSLRRVAN